MMGISAYIIWAKKKSWSHNWKTLMWFDLQLFLNVLWSVVFFGMQDPMGGLMVIFLLLVALAITIFKFYPISKRAAWLLVPYFLWGCFATVLNYYIMILN
jgi:tryptophan-rich sensory protein